MKTRDAAAVETQLLLQLVAAVRTLNVSSELEAGTILSLKCPCGKMILQPIVVLPSIKDRQRGLLKSKIENHLRDVHEVSKRTIADFLKDAFAAS
jgi:hypothetical protein